MYFWSKFKKVVKEQNQANDGSYNRDEESQIPESLSHLDPESAIQVFSGIFNLISQKYVFKSVYTGI